MALMRSDAQLIHTFLTGEKEDSDAAFQTVVERHGPMVLRVCRHVLSREPDAEDAFQATFLALARKAGSIHNRENLQPWLREVAHRTALRTLRRGARYSPVMEIREVEESHAGPENAASRNEDRLLLRAEVDGLPAKYRLLVQQTYMEGKSNEQVARLLRCPLGTVKGRLSRARDLLRARLSLRGWDRDEVRYRWGRFAPTEAADIMARGLEGPQQRP
jgi:RNA polymerase sigma factor (sigma-70 family)